MTETKPKLKLWPHPIEGAKPVPAFAVGGVTYYHWPNDLDMPVLRAHAGMDVYREISFNVHYDDLKAYFAAQKATSQKIREAFTIKNGTINLEAAVKATHEFDRLTDEIAVRAGWITDFGLVFKLASVLYFDENEDPRSYDIVYNSQVKIPAWGKALESKELPAFFLNQRISRLLGFKDTSLLDTPTYIGLLRELRKTAANGRSSLLQNLSDTLSSTAGNSAERTSLHSAMETLQQQTA